MLPPMIEGRLVHLSVGSLSMCHTLVIEDEPLIATHLAELVEEAGATSVDFARTELEAIVAARQRKPDIILSDVQLLDGTGPAAVVAIRRELGHVPVIFITASPHRCYPRDLQTVVMPKPFEPERLTADRQPCSRARAGIVL